MGYKASFSLIPSNTHLLPPLSHIIISKRGSPLRGVLSLVESQSLAAEQLAPGRNLPSCKWVVLSSMPMSTQMVTMLERVVSETVIGILGPLGPF
jgi:hypothetical protein